MGYEDRILDNMDWERRKNPDRTPIIEQAHVKALQMFEDYSIDPRNFTDVYNAEEIQRDVAWVERTKSKFEMNETKKAAQVLEAILGEQAELSNWLGNDVMTCFASEYDDFNGVDMVAEYMNESEGSKHLALAVDVTFGTTTSTEKFRSIGENILTGHMAEVKYYQSESYKGPLHDIPKVVIGVELERVQELAGLWLRNEKTALGNHPIRDLLLNQKALQLKVFKKIAEAHNQERLVESYANAQKIIQRVRAEQGIRNIGDLANDKVWLSIQNSLYYMERNMTK